MKSSLNKKFSIAISSAIACTTPFAFSSLTSCSRNTGIQFANFESYMNNKLMLHLENQYGVQFQWYTVTEMIETKFKNTYDLAIPSGYELVSLLKRNWLHKIQWDKFEIDGVTDSTSAKTLFAEPVVQAIDEMDEAFRLYFKSIPESEWPKDPSFNPDTFTVLDYGVPYFAQAFTFVYKGSPIEYYSAITKQKLPVGASPTWADIFYTISPQNPNRDTRFDNRIGMLDDAKSLYDIARIIETIEANPDHPELATNQMPEDSSIDNLKQTFKSLTSKAQSNWYTLNTDSGIISRNLADHSEHGYVAALSWSGDALYAAQGAGEFESYTGDQMHVTKPSGVSLDEIEFVVMNKKDESKIERLKQMYQVVYDTCLDGCKAEDIKERVDDEDRYKYWAMENWDTVNYTPILKTIYDDVVNENSDYWQDYDLETRRLFVSILQMSEAKSLFGRTLTPLQNSNTHWAWLETRGNL